MADRTSIERIAKILARANSDNVGEGETALLGAYARMNRDGVTFTDLLSLPERDLYQDALVRLAEHIVKEKGDLSPSQKRTLYAEYLKRIVEKFSPGSGGRGGESSKDQAQREREDAARAYEERRRQEEARRARSQAPPRQEQQKTEPPPKEEQRAAKPYSRQNVKTAQSGGWQYDPERFPLEFSIRNFFLFFFGPNSYIGSIYSYPKHALGLFFQSCLVGGLTFGALLIGLGFLIKSTNFSPVMLIGYVFFYNIGFTVAAIVFVTSYIFYERGWYPRGPREGETDFVSITTSTWRLIVALAWRLYGATLWLGFTVNKLVKKLRP